jgi:hypothetical protein
MSRVPIIVYMCACRSYSGAYVGSCMVHEATQNEQSANYSYTFIYIHRGKSAVENVRVEHANFHGVLFYQTPYHGANIEPVR